MALIEFSPVVANMAGSAGAVTFMGGRVGPIVRGRVSLHLVKTIARSLSQNNMQNAAAEFANLSPTDKATWNSAASGILQLNPITGQHYPMTGISYYCSLAIIFKMGSPGQRPPTAPPGSAFTGDSITITATGGTGQITWTGSAQQGAGIKTMFLTQLLPYDGRKPNPQGYRTLRTSPIPASPFQVNQNIGRGVYAVGYRFMKVTTGQATAPVYLANVTVS